MDTNQEAGNGGAILTSRMRMAYSYKGYQPVLCTLVCDQPLYYMEDEIFEEAEDGLFFEEEQMINAALGADFAPLQKKIGIYDEMARKFAADPEARLASFMENGASLGSNNHHTKFLDNLTTMLTQSRYGQSLLALAEKNNVTMCLSAQQRAATYIAASNTILVNPNQDDDDGLLSLVAALRMHEQACHGAGLHPLHFHPDEAILVNRAQAADRAAAQVRAAWELQLAGIQGPWARLENSQGCDLARAFAREALCDFRTLNNGKAAQAVFESWFLSDRCKIEDRELIQMMLADQEARLFGEPSGHLNASYLAALGEQSLGNNYLAAQAGTILADPLFMEVRDRSNANFLWFVKFERSFKETEQELQDEERETIHSFGNPQGRPFGDNIDMSMNQSNVVYVSFGGTSC